MLYQRKRLSDMSDIGDPAPLPQELWGSLSDEDLAHIGDLVPPERLEEYGGQGFFPVPPPPPPPPIRWLHKAILLQRIPAQKRIAIRGAEASDPIIADFMFLLTQSEDVDLDNDNLVAGLGYLVTQGLLSADDVAAVRA
jgi:hypothetical protein